VVVTGGFVVYAEPLQGVQLWALSLVFLDLHGGFYSAEGVGVFIQMFGKV
jgi:hypothetical protein